VSVAGLLPRFGVFEVKIDDDEWEGRYALASVGFKQTPEVLGSQEMNGGSSCAERLLASFAHQFDALPVQLMCKGGWRAHLSSGAMLLRLHHRS